MHSTNNTCTAEHRFFLYIKFVWDPIAFSLPGEMLRWSSFQEGAYNIFNFERVCGRPIIARKRCQYVLVLGECRTGFSCWSFQSCGSCVDGRNPNYVGHNCGLWRLVSLFDWYPECGDEGCQMRGNHWISNIIFKLPVKAKDCCIETQPFRAYRILVCMSCNLWPGKWRWTPMILQNSSL